MGKSFNKVFLIGNVGADPEVRSTTGGNRVATLTLATSRQWKDRSGVEQEKVQWHRLVCWNAERGQKLADLVEKYVHKGDRLHVEGEVEYRQWQDKEGQTRYTTEITVKELTLLSAKRGRGGQRLAARRGACRAWGRAGRPTGCAAPAGRARRHRWSGRRRGQGHLGRRLRGLPRRARGRGRRPAVLGPASRRSAHQPPQVTGPRRDTGPCSRSG
jgi:single-strand DNA-binding protein